VPVVLAAPVNEGGYEVKQMSSTFAMVATILTFGMLFSAAARGESEIPARVKEIIAIRCALCHGAEGESASAVYPRLAAQHPDYLAKQLRDFRDGRRKSDTMASMATDLKDEDIAAFATFFSSKTASFRQPGDNDLAAVGKFIFQRGNSYSGVPACSSCHGASGHGTHQLPRLAGQHPAYVEVQLKEFNKRERSNDNAIMHSVASKLTELETRAVSVFIGGLQ
jgi:cytochrome c553